MDPNQERAKTPQDQIDQKILSALTLTPEDFQQELQRQQQELVKSYNFGISLYHTLANPNTSFTTIELGSDKLDVSPIHQKDDVLPLVSERLAAIKNANPNLHDQLAPKVKAMLDGFGSAALELKDWRHAITCLNYISENGILNNQDALTKLNQLGTSDRIAVAQEIQMLQSPPQEPTLTPVPPPPSPVEV